jgi:drug/metabolite transporter (DMT)-like permease
MGSTTGGGVDAVKVALLTIASVTAFAGNSVLCRLALLAPGEGAAPIDPLSFTAVRLAAGALVLSPVLVATRGKWRDAGASWGGVAALTVYAVAFSLSYVTLPAGIGALLLFGLVQITMVGAGLLGGERLGPVRGAGMLTAAGGVVLLVAPTGGLLAGADVDPRGAALMAAAGVAWGAYSLAGRGQPRPVRLTAVNFALCLPLATLLLVLSSREWSTEGLLLAAASGAITSGAGYAIWYAALSGHTATSAAVVQLTVPVLAAAGGVVWLDEAVTPRSVAATALVLGGVAVALLAGARHRATARR